MSSFSKGDTVCVTDFPFGRCLKSIGVIVGILKNDYYNVKITDGFQSGMILRYKYWKLKLLDETENDE